jgi:hypothetical protein
MKPMILAAQMTSILAPGIYWLSHTWLAIDCTLPRILRSVYIK